MDTWMNIQTDRQTQYSMDGWTDDQTDRDRQTDGIDSQTDRQDRQTVRQSVRQTDAYLPSLIVFVAIFFTLHTQWIST